MNTLRIFTPGVFKTLSDNAFDHLFLNEEVNPDFTEFHSGRPRTNIIEEDDQFRIELALPGYSREQISMKYHEDILTISANVEESAREGMKYLTREFGLKNFSKRFTIPQTIDADKINAEFSNGILSITVPKKEEAKVKEPVEVQIN